MEKFITLNQSNIDDSHICCAISDKKSVEGVRLKKEWLKKEFENGYIFRRIDARAKVFMEYGLAENAWSPIEAPNFLFINCFWVSGQYKGKGYAKALLQEAIDDAKKNGKHGLVTIAGIKKFHFMSDPKWLIKQGFEIAGTTKSGFALFVYKIKIDAPTPSFKESVKETISDAESDLVVYYSDRCPFNNTLVNNDLVETAKKRNLSLKVVKLNTLQEAQSCPSPATIFSLFYKGKFVTTDISVCMDSRFDKIANLK